MAVSVVDLGVSNIESVMRALARIEVDAKIVRIPDDLASSRAIILPGVGTFSAGMDALCQTGLGDALQKAATDRRPILGICLGFQLLASSGDEGGERVGLGLIPGRVTRLKAGEHERVPNVGWCDVTPVSRSLLFADDRERPDSFYFLHGYHVICDVESDVIATFRFDGRSHTAVAQHQNVVGVQFHPEKSQEVGLALLHRFCVADRAAEA